MNHNFSTIKFWREEDIGVIIPSDENKALDSLMVSEILAVLLTTSEDKETNHIVITNQGTRNFIRPVSEFSKCNIENYVKMIRSMVIVIKTIGKDVIFAVNGNASGISAELAFTGDFLAVRSDIVFSLERIREGMPLVITDFMDYIKNKTLSSLLFGNKVTGQQLFDNGIAHFVPDRDSFYDSLKQFINSIPLAYRYSKVARARDFHHSYSDPFIQEKIIESLKKYYGL